MTATAAVTPELSNWCASVPVPKSQPALELPPPPTACLALRASFRTSLPYGISTSPDCQSVTMDADVRWNLE